MQKTVSIILLFVLILVPWYITLFAEREVEVELSCVANYELQSVNGNGQRVRAFGALLNDFFRDGKVYVHYVGSIERYGRDSTDNYKVNREGYLHYWLINNLLLTKTFETQNLLLDNSPDDLVQRFVYPGFQKDSIGRAFIYRVSEKYWAAGFSDSPRVLCKTFGGEE
ncbi:hypothetical protein FA378_26755 [Pseudomonas aeruginosa]|nr:hypothetical protein [Pseudomonas aeruginosa]